MINHHQGVSADDPRYGSASAYITFRRQEDAWAAICSVDGFRLMGRTIRASFGTSKYCNSFLRNLPCNNPDCLYLHELGDEGDRFTKDEVQLGLARHGSSFAFKEEVLGDRAGGPSHHPTGTDGAGSGGNSGGGVLQPTNPVFPPPCPMSPTPNGCQTDSNASLNTNVGTNVSGGVIPGVGVSMNRGAPTATPSRPAPRGACAGAARAHPGGEGCVGAQPCSPLTPGAEGRPRPRRRRGQRGRRGGGGGNGAGANSSGGVGVGAGAGTPCVGNRAVIGGGGSAGNGGAGCMDAFVGGHPPHQSRDVVDERFLLGVGGRRLASSSMGACLGDVGAGGGGGGSSGIERTLSLPLVSSLMGHGECGGGGGGGGYGQGLAVGPRVANRFLSTDRALVARGRGKGGARGGDNGAPKLVAQAWGESDRSSVSSGRSTGGGSTYGGSGGGSRSYWGAGHGLATPETLANTPPREFSTPSGSPMPSSFPGFGVLSFKEEWSIHGFGDGTGAGNGSGNGSEAPRDTEVASGRPGYVGSGGGGGMYAQQRHPQRRQASPFIGVGEGGRQASLGQQQQQQSFGGNGDRLSGAEYPQSELLDRTLSLDLGLDQYQERQPRARWGNGNADQETAATSSATAATRRNLQHQSFFENDRENVKRGSASSAGSSGNANGSGSAQGSPSFVVGSSLFDGRVSSAPAASPTAAVARPERKCSLYPSGSRLDGDRSDSCYSDGVSVIGGRLAGLSWEDSGADATAGSLNGVKLSPSALGGGGGAIPSISGNVSVGTGGGGDGESSSGDDEKSASAYPPVPRLGYSSAAAAQAEVRAARLAAVTTESRRHKI